MRRASTVLACMLAVAARASAQVPDAPAAAPPPAAEAVPGDVNPASGPSAALPPAPAPSPSNPATGPSAAPLPVPAPNGPAATGPNSAPPAPAPHDIGPATGAGAAPPADEALPSEHLPRVSLALTPRTAIHTGDAVRLAIRADALAGDDVAVPEQSFAPFEITGKRSRVEPEKAGRQVFVFELDLLALESGEQRIPEVELRIVTRDGLVGSTKAQALAVKVTSWLENVPNAQLKPATAPVAVTQDDFTLLYVLGGVGGAALVALLTWLLTRYYQRRVRPLPPPPPPRPPWEVAAEKLGELRRRKQRMVEEGKAAQFVDEVSDVAREYLGARYGFDGLESTTDEALVLLRTRECNPGLLQEVGAYLRRCDLIKFARVEPDHDEADLVFSKAQDIVQFSTPLSDAYGTQAAMPAVAAQPPQSASNGHPAAPRSQGPQ